MELISNQDKILTAHLFAQLYKYDIYDIPISGNPIITYFGQKSLPYQKSHTNFASGIIGIEYVENNDSTYLYNLKDISADILEQAIIIVDSINSIENICLEINNQKVHLTPDYIKVYSTVCSKLIFTTSTHTYISLPLILYDLIRFYGLSLSQIKYLPIINPEIKTVKLIVKSKTIPELKVKCSVIDTEERRKYLQFKNFDCKSQNFELLPDNDLMYTIKTYSNIVSVGIKLLYGFDSLESIEIYYRSNKIILTPNILTLYDQIQEQIIFGNIIKIKAIFGFDLGSRGAEFKIKINLKKEHLNQVQIYSCTYSSDINLNSIISFNEKFISFYQEYIFDKSNQIQITEKSQYHMTELFIFDKSKDINSILNVNLQYINNLNQIVYSNITDSHESILYQQSLYNKVLPKYFTIGFGMSAHSFQPSGELNISAGSKLKLITIDPTNESNGPIHVIICGYKSEIN